MHELLTVVAEMRQRATEMKSMIARAHLDPTRLRKALYELETAIYVMRGCGRVRVPGRSDVDSGVGCTISRSQAHGWPPMLEQHVRSDCGNRTGLCLMA